MPIAVKDDIDVAGEVTALGTNAQGGPARADAEVVRRLREAGAVIIGKTNVPELCVWPFTETATFGATRNPWDLQRAPGGSSGGSAAAVAAGLVGAALGSDGAGSIRIPAAWCGLFGLKPQRGRVSLAPRSRAWHGLSVNGVLTPPRRRHGAVPRRRLGRDRHRRRSRAGARGALLAGGRDRARAAADRALHARARRGRSRSSTPTPSARLSETVELLRSLGHEVVRARPRLRPRHAPGGDRALHARRPRRRARARAPRAPGTAHARDGAPGRADPRRRLLERALAGEAEFARRLNRVFEDHDVLITPDNSHAAAAIGRLQGRGALWTLNAVAGMVPYNGVWNVTGQPAASVPAGFGADGLPRGVQLVGRPNDEATLLSLAAQLEAERPWAQQRPPEFS